MAGPSTPHTESQQNRDFAESDLEPGVSTHTVGRGEDAALYEQSEGAQTGTNRQAERSPREGPSRMGAPETDTVREGSLTTRAPKGEGQGITSRSMGEESVGQEKVVSERQDAQSAVNEGK